MKICRKLLALACTAGLLAAPAAWAQNVRMGVLTDLGGPYADSSGLGAVEATKMAAEELKAELGLHHVDVISADHQSKPDVAPPSPANGWIPKMWMPSSTFPTRPSPWRCRPSPANARRCS